MRLMLTSSALVMSLILTLAASGQAQTPSRNAQQVQYVTVQPEAQVILDAPVHQPAARCKGGICGFFHRCLGPRCYGHHDEPLTGNCHSEMVFIFGSSRAFFGEPCRPIPPGAYGNGPGQYGCAPECGPGCGKGHCGR